MKEFFQSVNNRYLSEKQNLDLKKKKVAKIDECEGGSMVPSVKATRDESFGVNKIKNEEDWSNYAKNATAAISGHKPGQINSLDKPKDWAKKRKLHEADEIDELFDDGEGTETDEVFQEEEAIQPEETNASTTKPLVSSSAPSPAPIAPEYTPDEAVTPGRVRDRLQKTLSMIEFSIKNYADTDVRALNQEIDATIELLKKFKK